MQKIKQLPLSEIQKIAAGQVVERPSNVVKELVENSLDAGSTKISVYIEAGGERLIRVVDNGTGMSEVDAALSFERHATSKITNFEQLQTLATFGFRGEALYSIGAVSTVTLLTKEIDAPHGIQICFKEGNIVKKDAVSCAQGTDISVVDLFANVPARKKFLKKEETEWRVIVQIFQAFCFAYPSVHFQLFSDNKLVNNCPSVTNLIDRSAQLWDAHFANNLITLATDSSSAIKITGVISQQHFLRYNRNQIFFFVNKRWVKNYTLGQALLKGYLNVLPPARYPVAMLDISIDAHQVDVNIHPRKEEVKFLQPKYIENLVTNYVKKTLEMSLSEKLQNNDKKTAPEQNFSEPTFFNFFPKKDLQSISNQNSFNPIQPKNSEIVSKSELTSEDFFENLESKQNFVQEKQELSQNILSNDISIMQNSVISSTEQYEIIGVLKKTYIMVDHPEGIFFVDQHAAHERILFEHFSKRFADVPSIKLMFPEIVHMSHNDIQLLMEYSILLHEQGIILDQIGANQVSIQSIPVHLKSISWAEFLREICALLIEHAQLAKDEFFTIVNKKLQAQMACKAAVKAGDSLTHQQIIQLLDDLNSIENRFTCPHGRPTSWLLPLYDIEKKFKRKL
jgi:DNA mismatch repair protein MutL